MPLSNCRNQYIINHTLNYSSGISSNSRRREFKLQAFRGVRYDFGIMATSSKSLLTNTQRRLDFKMNILFDMMWILQEDRVAHQSTIFININIMWQASINEESMNQKELIRVFILERTNQIKLIVGLWKCINLKYKVSSSAIKILFQLQLLIEIRNKYYPCLGISDNPIKL